jgi:hypothetical protein
MTASQRWLIFSGLVLAAAGMVFGFVYTYAVDHQTLPLLREAYREAFTAAAANDATTSQAALERAGAMNYKYVRIVDVHTHLIKLATVLLLAGLVYPLVAWSEKIKKLAALCFVAGSLIFPSGVFLENFSSSLVPKAAAGGGALLAIASFAVILAGLFRGLGQQPTE